MLHQQPKFTPGKVVNGRNVPRDRLEEFGPLQMRFAIRRILEWRRDTDGRRSAPSTVQFVSVGNTFLLDQFLQLLCILEVQDTHNISKTRIGWFTGSWSARLDRWCCTVCQRSCICIVCFFTVRTTVTWWWWWSLMMMMMMSLLLGRGGGCRRRGELVLRWHYFCVGWLLLFLLSSFVAFVIFSSVLLQTILTIELCACLRRIGTVPWLCPISSFQVDLFWCALFFLFWGRRRMCRVVDRSKIDKMRCWPTLLFSCSFVDVVPALLFFVVLLLLLFFSLCLSNNCYFTTNKSQNNFTETVWTDFFFFFFSSGSLCTRVCVQ